jgi:hypothetical protein
MSESAEKNIPKLSTESKPASAMGKRIKYAALGATAAAAAIGGAIGFNAKDGGNKSGQGESGQVKVERQVESVKDAPPTLDEMISAVKAAYKGRTFPENNDLAFLGDYRTDEAVIKRMKHAAANGEPFTLRGSDFTIAENIEHAGYGAAVLSEGEKVLRILNNVYATTQEPEFLAAGKKWFVYIKEVEVGQVHDLGNEIPDGYLDSLIKSNKALALDTQ